MPKSNIISALEQLEKEDIYSLILFVLYRLKDSPEYSTLSELIYILDNESFINFLNYFGGTTIKVPTLDEMREIVNAILFYERSINSRLSQDEIFSELSIKASEKTKMLETIDLVKKLVNDYEFKRNKAK